jgi:hypothetical protein
MKRPQDNSSIEHPQATKAELERSGVVAGDSLRHSQTKSPPTDESTPWMRYAGMVETGDRHSSLGIDDISFGDSV